MLFNEPKLLKFEEARVKTRGRTSFSALQRAEIAEILLWCDDCPPLYGVSVLFNEPKLLKSSSTIWRAVIVTGFSALQRAEIAEIRETARAFFAAVTRFSALQRAEIAEIIPALASGVDPVMFQCSSTSRNC